MDGFAGEAWVGQSLQSNLPRFVEPSSISFPFSHVRGALPDGEYALDLRQHDSRVTAQQLVVLMAEKGTNLTKTSYNGIPFDVGAKWMEAVPPLGWFCATYVTPLQCASIVLRLGLARRMLMPGHGRWKAIPHGP